MVDWCFMLRSIVVVFVAHRPKVGCSEKKHKNYLTRRQVLAYTDSDMRKKPTDGPVSVRLDSPTKIEVKRIADTNNLSKSAVIRMAIKKGLSQVERALS